MKRAILFSTLLSLIALLPLPAQATWFGAYVQGHAGWQTTNRAGHPQVGAAAALTVIGFEAFADLRFLRDGFSEDRGMWNQLGLRWGMEIPGLDMPRLEPYLGCSYVFSKVATEDQDLTTPALALEEQDGWKGLNPHIGLRLDFPFPAVVSIGIQGELGYHYLFPNDRKYSSGLNYGGNINLRLSI